MKYLLSISVALFLIACSSPTTDVPAEVKTNEVKEVDTDPLGDKDLFVSEDGGFVIKFPGKPSYEPTTIESDIGKLRMEMYAFEESVTQAFMVAYTDYPTEHVEAAGAVQLLEAAFKGQINPLGITSVEANDDFTLNGLPAKYVRGSSVQWHLVSRMLMVGNRLYQVTILRDGSYPTKESEDAFIGSFHLMREHGDQTH